MGKGNLILKKAAKYASLRMLMDISGKDLVRIFKSIMFYRIDKLRDSAFKGMEGLHM
jgi:hypothetical protein